MQHYEDHDRRLAYPEAFAYPTQPQSYVVMTRADNRYHFAKLGRKGNSESRQTATTITWRIDPNELGCVMTEKQARGVIERLPAGTTGTAVMVTAKDALAAFEKGKRT